MSIFSLPVPDDELFEIAMRVARGDQSLAEEAAQHLRVQFWRGLYDPTLGHFLAWAATVIRRHCLDVQRPRLRAVGGTDNLFSDPADPQAGLSAVEFALDLTSPFCREDLATVRMWKPRIQFVLLGWHGVWEKLPEDDQHNILAVVKPAVPFPVPNFFAWPNSERTQYIASALRCPPNTVIQILLRYRHRLASLRFFREMGD